MCIEKPENHSFPSYNDLKFVKVSPDDSIFRSIMSMRLKAWDKSRRACDIACGFSSVLEAHAASKGFPLSMRDTCDFSFGRLCCNQVS